MLWAGHEDWTLLHINIETSELQSSHFEMPADHISVARNTLLSHHNIIPAFERRRYCECGAFVHLLYRYCYFPNFSIPSLHVFGDVRLQSSVLLIISSHVDLALGNTADPMGLQLMSRCTVAGLCNSMCISDDTWTSHFIVHLYVQLRCIVGSEQILGSQRHHPGRIAYRVPIRTRPTNFLPLLSCIVILLT